MQEKCRACRQHVALGIPKIHRKTAVILSKNAASRQAACSFYIFTEFALKKLLAGSGIQTTKRREVPKIKWVRQTRFFVSFVYPALRRCPPSVCCEFFNRDEINDLTFTSSIMRFPRKQFFRSYRRAGHKKNGADAHLAYVRRDKCDFEIVLLILQNYSGHGGFMPTHSLTHSLTHSQKPGHSHRPRAAARVARYATVKISNFRLRFIRQSCRCVRVY